MNRLLLFATLVFVAIRVTCLQAEDQPRSLIAENLLLDLDAEQGVVTKEKLFVESWTNQVKDSVVRDFVRQDEGRRKAGSGRPTLRTEVAAIGGRSTIVFKRQELVNDQDDAFDHLITGSGYTWFCVLAVDKQKVQLKDINSFFGNLRNSGKYEGIWGGFTDDNRLWVGVRCGLGGGRWNKNNPMILAKNPIEKNRFYALAGRMSAGPGEATVDLFINGSQPTASGVCPVNPDANPERMAIGQERDAINHPGKESFDGEIARFLLYDRPFKASEIDQTMETLAETYGLKLTFSPLSGK